MENDASLNCQIPGVLKERLDAFSRDKGIKMRKIVEDALNAFLPKTKKPRRK